MWNLASNAFVDNDERHVNAQTTTMIIASSTYLHADVARERHGRVRSVVHAVRIQVPDVQLHRRLVGRGDQSVRPRALARDVEVYVFTVGVQHVSIRLVVRRKETERAARPCGIGGRPTPYGVVCPT